MNLFTLSYSEYWVSNLLQRSFPKREGFSVHIPLSRQEEGIDVTLMRRLGRKSKLATIQIKASRTYEKWNSVTSRNERYSYDTWFNTFAVSDRADWYFLVGIWPPKEGRTKKLGFRWQHLVLVFTRAEMASFLKSVKTLGGKPDSKFNFGFDEAMHVFQTRGDSRRRFRNFSHRLFENRVAEIRRGLS